MIGDFIPPILMRQLRRVDRDVVRGGYVGLENLDRRLVNHIKPGRGGYFVELGAYDGIDQSNTYVLQRRFGWTGLLIEPSPVRFEQCVENRSFGQAPAMRCAACVPADYRGECVLMVEAGPMTVGMNLDVPTAVAQRHGDTGAGLLARPRPAFTFAAPARTLTSLLQEVDAPASIDLLSLDVEGNEAAVLRGLDLSRYSFRWILVEVRPDSAIENLLGERGYEVAAELTHNSSYRDLLFSRTTSAR